MARRLFACLQQLWTSSFVPETTIQDGRISSKPTPTIRQYSHNWFEDLPTEVILLITSQLDHEYVVLFSLSCKRAYNVLRTNVNLTFNDKIARIHFLHYLEIDHPEYLTCRTCDRMFKWAGKSRTQYACNQTGHYSNLGKSSFNSINVSTMQHSPVIVNPEIVDLISRSYELGPKYGIAISMLNGSGRGNNGIPRTVEARWIDGQLLVATRWVLEPKTKHDMAEKLWILNPALCLHWWTNMASGRWRTLEHRVLAMTGKEEKHTTKCRYCDTDSRISLQDRDAEQPRVIVNVWRNFGSRSTFTLGTDQIFHKQPALELDLETVDNRNLQVLFTSTNAGIAST